MLGNRIYRGLAVKSPKDKNFIRVGKDNDGGYVIVDDIKKDDFLISMGILDDVSFEQGMSSMVSGIHLYDYSIEELPDEVKNSTFFKEKITNDSNHIFDRVPNDKDIILKIDIEGSEWEFFESLSDEHMNRFKQIIVEIHWFSKDPEIGVKDCPIHIIEKINKTHQIVALHPNNFSPTVTVNKRLIVPQVIELTLLRKSDYQFSDYDSVPKELFMPNNLDAPDIKNYLVIL